MKGDLPPEPAFGDSIFDHRIVRLLLLRVLFLLVAAGLAACDSAPHDNPLDPCSPRFRNAGRLSGTVAALYTPEPRAGVRVRAVPQGDAEILPCHDGASEETRTERIVMTDAAGAFEVEGLASGSYLVIAEGDGLEADTTLIRVSAGSVATTSIRINTLPVVTSTMARTVHILAGPATSSVEQFFLEVSATVIDADRIQDVSSVTLVLEAIGQRVPMTIAPSVGNRRSYAATVQARDLPGGSLEPLLGELLTIEVEDVNGNVVESAPFGLVRIIDATPIPVAPSNFETVAGVDSVDFAWDAPELPFAYSFDFVLTKDQPGADILIEDVTLDGSMTTFILNQSLAPGAYFWSVAYVDAAGNRSRSSLSVFEVL